MCENEDGAVHLMKTNALRVNEDGNLLPNEAKSPRFFISSEGAS